MGEIADDIVNGEICDCCCSPLKIIWGYPVTCVDCDGDAELKYPSEEDGGKETPKNP